MSVKSIAKALGFVLFMGVSAAACPEVQTTERGGRCFERTVYASLITTTKEVSC